MALLPAGSRSTFAKKGGKKDKAEQCRSSLTIAADDCVGYGLQNGDEVDIFADQAVAADAPDIVVRDLFGESDHKNRGADAAFTYIAAYVEPRLIARQRIVEEDHRETMLLKQPGRIVVIAGEFYLELRQATANQVHKPLMVFDAKD